MNYLLDHYQKNRYLSPLHITEFNYILAKLITPLVQLSADFFNDNFCGNNHRNV